MVSLNLISMFQKKPLESSASLPAITTDMKLYDLVIGDRTYKIVNDAHDHLLGHSLDSDKTWEPWQFSLYTRLISPTATCLDIGGNVGVNALAMAAQADKGRVFSFEPIPFVFDLLTRNIALNDFKNITPLNCGCSNADGTETIVYDRQKLGCSHLIQSTGSAQPDNARPGGDDAPVSAVAVRLRRLDDWIAENGIGTIGFVKVDVEGFELEVLEGAPALFTPGKAPPSIFEFSVMPQRGIFQFSASLEPRRISFPDHVKDVTFFHRLAEVFRHILLIGRDGRLHPVDSYADLRIKLLNGYPNDDLLCVNDITDAIADLIDTRFPIRPLAPVRAFTTPAGLAVSLNTHDDGCAGEQMNIDGTRAGLLLSLQRPAVLTLSFAAVFTKHATCPVGPVMVAADNDVRFVEVADRDAAVSLPLEPGEHRIFLESEFSFSAAAYFSNPADTRTVGFRFDWALESR